MSKHPNYLRTDDSQPIGISTKTAYEAGYCAFSEDPDGSIARAVADHFSGKMPMSIVTYPDDWHFGYQDATDDFNNAQGGGE